MKTKKNFEENHKFVGLELKRKVGPLFGKMTPLLLSLGFGPKMWGHFRMKVGSLSASGITIPFFQPSNILSLVLSV